MSASSKVFETFDRMYSLNESFNPQINTSIITTDTSDSKQDESNNMAANFKYTPFGYSNQASSADSQNDSSRNLLHHKDTQLSTVESEIIDIDTDKKPKQLTCRSIIIGLFLGAILCFSNTYFGLQTGWVTMGSLQSSLAGYGILQLCDRYNIGQESNKFELNMIQTIAVASATMPLAAGFVGIIPALSFLTTDDNKNGAVKLNIYQLFVWTFSLASFGVFLAVPLRKYMVRKLIKI